jgi:anti-sigma-K factor RskA
VERSTDTRIYSQPSTDHTADAESLAGLYAFGVLDGAELLRFERHLAGCGRCAEVVDGDLAMVGALSLTVPEVEATPGFKERLLERAAAELDAQATESTAPAAGAPGNVSPFRSSRAPQSAGRSLAWLLPLAAVIIALLAGAGLLSRQFAAVQVVQTAALQNSAGGGRAEVLVRSSGEGVIQLQGFQSLNDGRVYQAWVVRPGSQPLAVGASTDGNGTLTLDGDIRGATVAVTLEPGPGARAPSATPFLVGEVPT